MVSWDELAEAWHMFWHTLRWSAFVLCVWFLMLYLIALVLRVFT
jgi:hypothetical protein